MTEDTAPDWEKGTNIPKDAVQYWGKCKACEVVGFVSANNHKCCRCNIPSEAKKPKKVVEKVPEKKEEPKEKPKEEPEPELPKEEPETKGEGVDDREDQ